jgi:hypothetical protein
MNETKTSDRLAELTTEELLTEMTTTLRDVQVITNYVRERVEESDNLGEKVAFVSYLTAKTTPMLEEVQALMSEYNARQGR